MRFLLFFILLVWFKSYCVGQDNEYFNHNESWATEHAGTPGFPPLYTRIQQVGNTIHNGETYVKMVEERAYEGTPSDTNYWLTKSISGKAYWYNSDLTYSLLGDSVIYDYSRTDSITIQSFSNTNSNYLALPITTIDTIQFGSTIRKVFTISGNTNSLVYEGIPEYFVNFWESSNILSCYSIHNVNYSVQFKNFTENPSGDCFLYALNIDELFLGDKKRIKIVDMLGREAILQPNTPLLFVFDDGTTEQVFIVE